MSDRKTAIFGVYTSRDEVASAVERFRSSGFRDDDISVVLSGEQGPEKVEDIGSLETKGVNENVKDVSSKQMKDVSSSVSANDVVKNAKMPRTAATGAGIGAALGGTMGWLAALPALAIPGLGPLLIGGPLFGAFVGATAGGAVGAGAVGALVGVGIPEDEAKLYEERLKKGGRLVAVHIESREEAERARQIFRQTGATDISTTQEAKPEATKGIPRAAGH
jgi:hypothetical protein